MVDNGKETGNSWRRDNLHIACRSLLTTVAYAARDAVAGREYVRLIMPVTRRSCACAGLPVVVMFAPAALYAESVPATSRVRRAAR